MKSCPWSWRTPASFRGCLVAHQNSRFSRHGHNFPMAHRGGRRIIPSDSVAQGSQLTCQVFCIYDHPLSLQHYQTGAVYISTLQATKRKPRGAKSLGPGDSIGRGWDLNPGVSEAKTNASPPALTYYEPEGKVLCCLIEALRTAASWHDCHLI